MNAPANTLLVASAPCAQFAPSLTNRTHDPAYIEDELAPSIATLGVLQPITARPWPASRGPAPAGVLYELIIGEGRWLGAQAARLDEIPFFWRDVDDRTALEMQLVENLKRKDLTPIEEAEGYRRLLDDHGYTPDRIGDDIGKSRAYVYARLKLLDLCDAGRRALLDGKIDASTALLVARIPGTTLQIRAVKEIGNGFAGEPMSYRAAQQHLKQHFTISLKQATFPLHEADLVPAAGSCTDCPKRSGNCPEIAADIADADVCTDTACFDQKRQARRDQLIANAEARGARLVGADELPYLFSPASIDQHCDDYVRLDAKVDGDGQGRTYREILGDAAPTSALVEVGCNARDKQLVEVATPSAMKEALKAAGWSPDLFKSEEERANAEAEEAERAAEKAEREAKQQTMKTAKAFRQQLQDDLVAALCAKRGGDCDWQPVLAALAVAAVQQESDYNEFPEELLASLGIDPPADEIDDDALAAYQADVYQQIVRWPAGRAAALLCRLLTESDLAPAWDDLTAPPTALCAIAAAVDVEIPELPALLSEPASTPSEAARAAEMDADENPEPAAPAGDDDGDGSDEEDPDPAPASPANEATSSLKTEATPAPAWPFPTADRSPGKGARYRHPVDNLLTWSGRGRKPRWIEDWLASGKTLAELEALEAVS